ncbi:MAG: TonB-dependent receptor, partial [Spirochaetia bacterium]|nr:TonB-dependent receptor [Spirochaetia bacterium]
VYPLLDNTTGRLVTVDNLKVPTELAKLYGHLVDRGCIESIHNFNKDYLSIFSREVLRKIREGEAGWEASVPPVVADLIKNRGLFGFVPGR